MQNTHIVTLILGEQLKELVQEDDELVGHGGKLVDVAVGIDIAEPGSDWVVHKEQVREFVPRAIVQFESFWVLDSVGSNLHERTVLGTASWTTIDPDDGPLLIGNVLVLEVPEEEVSVALGCNFYVPVITRTRQLLGAA